MKGGAPISLARGRIQLAPARGLGRGGKADYAAAWTLRQGGRSIVSLALEFGVGSEAMNKRFRAFRVEPWQPNP